LNKAINKNRLIYLISAIGGHFYILFTIPLLTKYLSKDEFGFYIILIQIVVVTQASLLVLFSNGLLKFWVDIKEEEKKSFMGTILISFLSVATFIIFLMYLYRDEFFGFLFPNVNLNLNPTLLYTLLWLFVISFRSFLLSLIKALERPKFALIHIVFYGILLIGLLYYQLLYADNGISEVMLSFFMAEIVALGVLFIPTINNFKLTFNLEYLKVFMKFSLPLIGGSLAFIAFMNIDRVVLAQYVSLEEMGVYGIGFMFGSIAGMIVTANMSAYLPRVKKVMASGNEREVKRLTTHYIQEIQHLMLIVVILIAVFNDLIIYLFANNYSGSLSAVVMVGVAMGYLARSRYLFFKHILFLKNKVNNIFFNEIITLVVGFLFAVPIIKYIGVIGASIVATLTYIIMNIITYIQIKRFDLIDTKNSSLLKNIIFIFAIIILEILKDDNSYLIVKSIEFAIFMVLTFDFYKKYCWSKV
jgi:O-antigen/teichoic acid export membrane protein